jgi:Protein of unknown function (DUF3800)
MLLFSDECGFWGHGTDLYYVRAWLSIAPKEYAKVQQIFDDVSQVELKWANSGELLRRGVLENIDGRIFITVTPLDAFRAQNFAILRAIEQMEDSVFAGYKAIEPVTIKSKMKDATRQVIFLSYHERQHVLNAIDAFQPSGLNSIIIDSPQFSSGLYNPMLRNLENEKNLQGGTFKIAGSDRHRGLQFADMVAGAMSEFLTNDPPSTKCTQFLKNIVKPRMLNMSSKTSPNPNMIFWDGENSVLLDRFKQLRRL